jgi:ribosome-associated toxin RatA of RatAB toxin-antitoxin module
LSKIKRSALVHYSPAEMYDLVNDVGAYAEFLPWCKSSKVVEQSEHEMIASIEMSRGVLNSTFTTRNRLKPKYMIEISLVDGPFQKLGGFWKFNALKCESASKIILELDFEFDSRLMSIAAKPVFTQIANSLVDSFCRRAVEVYGERG